MPKASGCEVTITIRDSAVVAGLRMVAAAEGHPTLDACVESILRIAFRAALEGGRKMAEEADGK